jgi:phosphoglycolate phosphatase
MRKEYKYILFDLDGTITDPKLGITKSIQFALSNFGIKVTDLHSLIPFIGPPLKETFSKHYSFDEENVLKAIEKYREYFRDIGIYENLLYDGMDNLFQKLVDNNKTLIIATSKPTVFAKRILEYFNINHYFTFISGSELDGTRSKKSDVIHYALIQNNITNLKDVLMVGDREHDIIGANEIGIDSVGVLYGYGDYDELTKAKATYLASNLEELSQILL